MPSLMRPEGPVRAPRGGAFASISLNGPRAKPNATSVITDEIRQSARARSAMHSTTPDAALRHFLPAASFASMRMTVLKPTARQRSVTHVDAALCATNMVHSSSWSWPSATSWPASTTAMATTSHTIGMYLDNHARLRMAALASLSRVTPSSMP